MFTRVNSKRARPSRSSPRRLSTEERSAKADLRESFGRRATRRAHHFGPLQPFLGHPTRLQGSYPSPLAPSNDEEPQVVTAPTTALPARIGHPGARPDHSVHPPPRVCTSCANL